MMTEPIAKEIARAISDPGAFTPRGDDHKEPIPAWSARAVLNVVELHVEKPLWKELTEALGVPLLKFNNLGQLFDELAKRAKKAEQFDQITEAVERDRKRLKTMSDGTVLSRAGLVQMVALLEDELARRGDPIARPLSTYAPAKPAAAKVEAVGELEQTSNAQAVNREEPVGPPTAITVTRRKVALTLLCTFGSLSVSKLQRGMHLSYHDALRVMQDLESEGWVKNTGTAGGAVLWQILKPRQEMLDYLGYTEEDLKHISRLP